jgi:gamma-glutamyltranspeptidase/glutathione hydrolase
VQAGLRMLQAGGNAVDAAIAAAAVTMVAEPCSNGLGSDMFSRSCGTARELHGLNASGPPPRRGRRATSATGTALTQPAKRGWDSRHRARRRGGLGGACTGATASLPFEDLLGPAIELAERGYGVPAIMPAQVDGRRPAAELTTQPGFSQTFLPHGRAPHVGRALRHAGGRAHAAAHRRHRAARPTTGGEIAQAAVEAHARAHGGATTAADFAAGYQPEWVTPISAPLPRPHRARDPAQRAGHRRAHRAGHRHFGDR